MTGHCALPPGHRTSPAQRYSNSEQAVCGSDICVCRIAAGQRVSQRKTSQAIAMAKRKQGLGEVPRQIFSCRQAGRLWAVKRYMQLLLIPCRALLRHLIAYENQDRQLMVGCPATAAALLPVTALHASSLQTSHQQLLLPANAAISNGLLTACWNAILPSASTLSSCTRKGRHGRRKAHSLEHRPLHVIWSTVISQALPAAAPH